MPAIFCETYDSVYKTTNQTRLSLIYNLKQNTFCGCNVVNNSWQIAPKAGR